MSRILCTGDASSFEAFAALMQLLMPFLKERPILLEIFQNAYASERAKFLRYLGEEHPVLLQLYCGKGV